MFINSMKEAEEFVKALERLSNNKEKVRNSAPKTIKGDYELYIHGNKIAIVDKINNINVETKCSPEDNFDIGVGIQEAFKKLNEKREEIHKQKELEEESKKIRVGDFVEVVNPGIGCYPGKIEFFNNHKTQQYAPYYRYGIVPVKGTIGKVLYIEENKDKTHNIYVIQEESSPCYGEEEYKSLTYRKGIYLVLDRGIKKVVNYNV